MEPLLRTSCWEVSGAASSLVLRLCLPPSLSLSTRSLLPPKRQEGPPRASLGKLLGRMRAA
eukprot:1483671-Pyramimonas_sp.AAC.1